LGVSNFFKDIKTFIQQECAKLIKNDSKLLDVYLSVFLFKE